jgi:hypothetical protein
MRKSKKIESEKKVQLSEDAQKIIANMDKVWRDLLAYKKSKKSPLVIS